LYAVGDLKKTVGIRLDIDPMYFNFKYKENIFENDENLFNLLNLEIKEFVLSWKREMFNVNHHNTIEIDIKDICFDYNLFKINLSLYKHMKFKIVKEILAKKMYLEGVGFKFHLNEAIFDDNSRIGQIPTEINMIRMTPFQIDNQLISFL
jgi:hypothetical protein